MKQMKIMVLLLCIVLLLCACSGTEAAQTTAKETQGITQPATTEAGDAQVENWTEEAQPQPSDGETETVPTATTQSTEPPASQTESQPTTGETETQPTVGETEMPTGTAGYEGGSLNYQEYLALSSAERQAYVESFPTMEEALLWYEAAKKAYEESQDNVEISGGSVDLGDIQDSMGE